MDSKLGQMVGRVNRTIDSTNRTTSPGDHTTSRGRTKPYEQPRWEAPYKTL